MKKLIFIFSLLVALTACGSDTYNVSVEKTNKAAGLELEEIIILTKTIKLPEELEAKINEPKNPYNFMDLDDNEIVDYVNVTGYGDSEGFVRGFSFTVAVDSTNTQEIATIDIEKTNTDKVNVNAHGNSSIYGDNYHHHAEFGLSDFLLYQALFSNPYPTFYHSPYHYGNYPTYYQPVRVVEVERVREVYKTRPRAANIKITKVSQPVYSNVAVATKIASPNKDKVATNIRAVLAKPTESQRAFQIKNPPTKRIEVKAFDKKTGKLSTTTNTPSSSNSATTKKDSGRISVGGFGKSSSSSKSSSPSKPAAPSKSSKK